MSVREIYKAYLNTAWWQHQSHIIWTLYEMCGAGLFVIILFLTIKYPECSKKLKIISAFLDPTVMLEGSKCTAYKRQDGTVEITGQVISEQYFDLPRINYKYNAREYTYAYGVEVNPKGVEFSRVIRRRQL